MYIIVRTTCPIVIMADRLINNGLLLMELFLQSSTWTILNALSLKKVLIEYEKVAN